MNILNNYIGLFGCLLLLIATPLVFFRQPRHSRRLVSIIIVVMMIVAAIPVYDLPVVAYIRAVVTDLSITSMLLLTFFIATAYTGKQYICNQDKNQLSILILLAALLVYPFGLGLGMWDSYALGFGNIWLYSALLIISFYFFMRQRMLLMYIILAGCAAYLFSLLASQNLWDYLIDPLLVIYTVTTVIKQRLHSHNHTASTG